MLRKMSTKKKKTSHSRINEYRVIEKLGEGSFSKVMLCMNKKTRQYYAIKQMNKEKLRRKRFGLTNFTAYDLV